MQGGATVIAAKLICFQAWIVIMNEVAFSNGLNSILKVRVLEVQGARLIALDLS